MKPDIQHGVLQLFTYTIRNDFCLLLYQFTIVLIILVIIIVVTIWKRKQRRMVLIERIQLHNYNTTLHPEYMNTDMKGKLGGDPFLEVIQDPIYESLEQLPHNEDSYDVLRSFQGQTPSPLPLRSSKMPLDSFTVKDKEDTISIQSKRSDGDYMSMNATNPFYIMDGEISNKDREDEGGNQ